MDFKKYFTEAFLRELGLLVYGRVIYPALKDMVESTENTWDDGALVAADGLIRDYLAAKVDGGPAPEAA